MARRTRRRYYKKRGKWSANIQEINTGPLQISDQGNFYVLQTLAQNPAQNTNTISQTYTVKNFELNFVLENFANASGVDNLCCYIMYVPQGMTVTELYNTQHPEYILNYKYIGSPTVDAQIGDGAAGQQYQPIKMRSRMARKLQTGDSIVLFVKGFNSTLPSASIRVYGLLRWWTKAN